MAEPRAKRAKYSAGDVIGMLEDVYDDEVDPESDSDADYSEDEVMCEGSDGEFYDFDKEDGPPQDLDFYSPADLHDEREEM